MAGRATKGRANVADSDSPDAGGPRPPDAAAPAPRDADPIPPDTSQSPPDAAASQPDAAPAPPVTDHTTPESAQPPASPDARTAPEPTPPPANPDADPTTPESAQPVAEAGAGGIAPESVEPSAKGAGPVEEPPAPLAAKPKRRRWPRVVLVSLIVLVVLAGGAVGTGIFLVHRYAGRVHQEHLLGGAAATASAPASAAPAPASISGPINILMVGIDERADDPTAGARSDTIIILHVPAGHERGYLISIPRDSRVHIPAFPKTGFEGGTDKINAAFSYGFQNGGGRDGGFELLALTVKELTGLSFNAGAIVNFAGFQQLVDALGGVDLCVDEKTISVHVGWDETTGVETPPFRLVGGDYHPVAIPGVRPQIYYPGCQHMSGWMALDYVRQRELIPDGDYGRERHQQQFLKAIASQLTATGLISNPLRADAVLRAAADTVTFDGNGYSVTDWIFNLRHLGSGGGLTMLKTNGGQFNTEVRGGVDYEILDDTTMDMFQAVRDDTLDDFVAAHPSWVAGDGSTPLGSPSPSPTSDN